MADDATRAPNEAPRPGAPLPSDIGGSVSPGISMKNDAGGGIESPIVGGVSASGQGTAHVTQTHVEFHLNDIPKETRDLNEALKCIREQFVPTTLKWVDPTRPLKLPEPIEPDGVDIRQVARQLREQRILVVECVDGDIQLGVSSAIEHALGGVHEVVWGDSSDAAHVEGAGTGDGHNRGLLSLEDVLHPALCAGKSCVVLLGVAAGSALFDDVFASVGAMRTVGKALDEQDRYLLLLPHRCATAHEQRGFELPRLQVPFLSLWLRNRFPANAGDYETALQAQLDRGDWGGEENRHHALHDWLCGFPRGRLGEQQLQQQCSTKDTPEPRPLAAVRAALDRADGADELFLTAVFVAAYMPGLTQHDFSRAVEALLGDRTLTRTPAANSDSGQSAPIQPEEISLVLEWRTTMRRVMKDADLELRATPDGPKIVCFHAAHAAARVKEALDWEPMFLDTQLEHLFRSGLVFDRSRATSEAVIEFVAAVAAEDPERVHADWMLGLLSKSRLDTRHLPYTPVTSQLHGDEWRSRYVTCAHRLLRRLIDSDPGESSRERGGRGLATVSGVLDRLLFRLVEDEAATATIGLELVYRLRNAPGFDVWYWIRQAVERGGDHTKNRAHGLIRRLVGDPVECGRALTMLFGWLPGESGAGRAAARAVADCLVASLRYAPGGDATRPPPLTTRLYDASNRGGDPEQASALVAAAFHPLVRELAIGKGGLDVWLARLLLPDLAVLGDKAGDLGPRLGDLATTWLEVTRAILEDDKDHELAAGLSVALILAVWGHAHAGQPAVAQVLALAVRDRFAESRHAIQLWLGIFDDVMSRCEDLAAGDRVLDDEQRIPWVEASATKRRAFLDLRRWVAQGVPSTERVWMT